MDRRMISVVIFCYICFIIFLLIDFGCATDEATKLSKGPRQRRYLSFINGSKFFLRLNFKANMVRWNQIFAQALGFRMNWDDPPDTFRPYHRLYRRTVYNNLETILDKNGLNGFQCVRRAVCEMDFITSPRGLYNKILKMIFRRQSSDTDRWHLNVTKEECSTSINQCPFSFRHVSLYTDL
ncbi:hypothetical protein ACJJTC_017304 [Scirpophaga incertulas]